MRKLLWHDWLGLALCILLLTGAKIGGATGLAAGVVGNLTISAAGVIDSIGNAAFSQSFVFRGDTASLRAASDSAICFTTTAAGGISSGVPGTADICLTRVGAGILRLSAASAGTGAGALAMVATTFAALGTPANGTITYCSDCDATCANGSSTGKICARVNGAWAAL